MTRIRSDHRGSRQRRQGIALVLVLLIVAILVLAVYQFADAMLAHLSYVRTDHRYDAERLLAESAAESMLARWESAAESGQPRDPLVTEIPARSRSQLPRQAGMDGDFAVYHFRSPLSPEGIAPGLIDESSKLNLNCLPLDAHHHVTSRQALLHVPNMTASLADCILDWLDADDVTRPLGAESSYYTSLPSPYPAANQPISSLDELLLVRGVTRELLYGTARTSAGEPTPRHGPEVGWNRFLTVVSCERNVDRQGRPRIDLNDPQLVRLYDQLSARLSPEQCRFIVALRLAGPWKDGKEVSRLNPRDHERPGVFRRIAEQLEEAAEESLSTETSTPILRGGLDLSHRPVYRIRSLVDLWGTKVRILVEGRDELLASPWKDSSLDLRAMLAELAGFLTTSNASRVSGRVNINFAPREVLRAIPGMPTELADAIHARQRDISGKPWADRLPNRATLSWLLEENLMNPATLRDLAPYITCRGDVLQGFVVCRAHPARSGGTFRLVLDGSRFPAAVHCLQYVSEVPSPILARLLPAEDL